MNPVYCRKCRAEIDTSQAVCPKCNHDQRQPFTPPPTVDEEAAIRTRIAQERQKDSGGGGFLQGIGGWFANRIAIRILIFIFIVLPLRACQMMKNADGTNNRSSSSRR